MVDLSYYIQLSGNNPSFLLRVMNVFVNNTQTDILELEMYLNENNFKNVKEVCHKLKATFKSYKLDGLVSDIFELEMQAKSKAFSERSIEILHRVKEQYASARSEILELMSKERF